MNRKGQALGIGAIMVTFIAILVGVILFQSIAQQTGQATNTATITNESINGGSAVDNVSTYYIAYRAISGTSIGNSTFGPDIAAANYTITDNVINPDNGELSVSITPATDVDWDVATDNIWVISGTVEPQTYVGGAANAIVGIIAIFFALAIAIIALEPTLRSGVLNNLGI